MATPAASELDQQPTISAAATPGFHHYERFLAQLSFAGELAVGALCLWLSAWFRGLLPGTTRPLNWLTLSSCLALLGLTFAIAEVSRRSAHAHQRARIAIASVAAAAAVLLPALFFLRTLGNSVSRPTLLLFTLFLALGTGAWEHASATWLARSARQRPRFLVVVGDPGRQRAVASQVTTGPWRLAGSLDDSCDAPGTASQRLAALKEIIRQRPVDEIVLAASLLEGRREQAHFYRGVIDICEQTGIKLHVLSDWLTDYHSASVDHLCGRPVLSFSFAPSSPWALLAKRATDVALSAALLLFTWPLLIAVAIAVRLDSPGPALFRQSRCGLRGRTFTILKFRSMVANAEGLKAGLRDSNELSGPAFKITRDPRVTRVGRWLRKTSLDELPQLWNVLKGDMSLVGPRPPLPEEVEQYRLGSLRRLAMKPGITGLWQVSGRNTIRDFEEWVRLDAEYIRNWSLLTDLKIIARTIGAVLQMTGK